MTSSKCQKQLQQAQEYANLGKNDLFLAICEGLANQHIDDAAILVPIARLLQAYGFSSQAKQVLTRAKTCAPEDHTIRMRLANTELTLGNLSACEAIYSALMTQLPNDLDILQQSLFLAEYLPNQSNAHLLGMAKRWGNGAIQLAGGPFQRPPFRDKQSETPLRVGYVSADFCQHTVGLLLKDVIANHNPDAVEVFTYSSGLVEDWVTQQIRDQSHFHNISGLSDRELALLIQDHQIDVLIDLSGHTAGSRLAAFAYRPAPAQLSWLGYYASTGLDCIDAVLLDRWHVCNSTASQFLERIELLPIGRWCYYPAFPVPAPSPPPVLKNGFITFGSFNNTLKYNPTVYSLWASILHAVPHSKLILKWRTFNDQNFVAFVLSQFAQHGIDPSRIELRGPSFHLQMLEEYQDIDIALDPFPFSGGITSCEALYMGVPVITWPQERVVSRQTYAFLSIIQHPELAVDSPKDYLEKAKSLSNDIDALCEYRNILRLEMIRSPLMQVKQFTQSLESAILSIHNRIKES